MNPPHIHVNGDIPVIHCTYERMVNAAEIYMQLVKSPYVYNSVLSPYSSVIKFDKLVSVSFYKTIHISIDIIKIYCIHQFLKKDYVYFL